MKRRLKEPTIRNAYQFPNVPSHEWHNWKVDDGSPILNWTRGKIIQQEITEILCVDSSSCKEAGNNHDYHRSIQRQTFNMSVTWMRISFDHLQQTGSIIVLSFINVKLSFLFVALYSALYTQFSEMCQKIH